MTVGGVVLWNQTGKMVIEDRERVFGALANLAQHDLEDRLERVAQDLELWSSRWYRLGPSTVSADGQQEALNWAFSFRGDQRPLYELVVYVDRTARINFANSPGLPSEAVEESRKLTLESLLDLPPKWLDPLLSTGQALAVSPRPIKWINEQRRRPTTPRTRDDVPLHYQMVFAVPARAQNGADIQGAVIAVTSWNVFQEELDRFKTYSTQIGLNSGYAFLVDNSNSRVIGHEVRDPGPTGENFYTLHLIDHFQLPDVAAALRAGSLTPVRYDFRGPKFAAVRRVSPPLIFKDRISWGLGVAVKEDEIRQSVRRISFLYAVVGTLVTLGVLTATVMVGRHLSLSVKELIRVARAASGSAPMPQDSDDEIAELQQVVNDLAVRQRQNRAFTPLTNPYIVGNPIHHGSMFFGRTEDVAWINTHLQQPGNELILLTGQRRIGKTSLLRHVKRSKNELGLIPFFIDTQSLIPSVTDDQSFYVALLEELKAQFHDAIPDLAEPTLPQTETAQESIWKLFKYLNNSRPKAIPVLLIDELENFEHKFKSKTLTPDVLKFLAALLDSTRTVSFIATGSDRLEKRKARYWSALLVKSVRRHLGVLSTRDALRMVTEPLAGKVTYAADVPRSILRLSGCHPYYTQDICQRVVNEINRRQTYNIDQTVLNEVVTQALMNPPPTLDYFWNKGVRVQGRVFLSLLASVLADEDARVSVQDVIDAASPALRRQLVASQNHLVHTLEQLISGDWLDDERGLIRFKADLLRLWLKREHPPNNVEVEILYPVVREVEYGV
jgi:hypothetical protein